MEDKAAAQKKQVLYWRLIATLFGYQEKCENINQLSRDIVKDEGMPGLILDPAIGIETLQQRYPELEPLFKEDVFTDTDSNKTDGATSLKPTLAYCKMLLNIFGPNTQTQSVSASQYSQWLKDVGSFERAFGFPSGGLRGKKHGGGEDEFLSEEMLGEALSGMEKDLIDRMEIHEILNDDKLAQKLKPSMPLVEQLLRDKANLSKKALQNAKAIIQQFINELAEVLKTQVMESKKGGIDYSVPPKKVFSNLDLKRTIWKNLINWDPDQKKLYVDRLFYKHTAQKKLPKRMIVVVDQSGSMVDAMVQCTIIASIFAGLPNVDVHLVAFDTDVADLTPWVHDPFEVLMRTDLGGGTDIYNALIFASEKILEPQNTVLVLISDFYEGGSEQQLFDYIKTLKDSDVHVIPVGAVTSTGYFSVNQWFRSRLKDIGAPILTGSPKKLIDQLRAFLG
ncbi:MAG: VWA domain-containing protein [bacterium]|nr:VWA domain-containing protein [bacterium]